MQSSETGNKVTGCYAVKYKGIIWASFRKEAIVDYFSDIPNIEEMAKYFDADPVFDDSNPVVDSLDSRDISAGDAHIRYPVCDRSALEFQLSVAAKQAGQSVVCSEVCNILVSQKEALDFISNLREDTEALLAEDDWYQENGERSQEVYAEICKAAGKEIGRC